MALTKELENYLGQRLAKTNLGNLHSGYKDANEKGMLWEILDNQFCIMMVLAEMNGMSSDPKAYRDLLD
jgi:hypothetical protein